MDLTDFRITWTVVSALVFLGIVLWATSSGARRRFEEAAQLPFLDECGAQACAPAKKEDAQ